VLAVKDFWSGVGWWVLIVGLAVRFLDLLMRRPGQRQAVTRLHVTDQRKAVKKAFGWGLMLVGLFLFANCMAWFDTPPTQLLILSGVCAIAGLFLLFWAYKPTRRV
jgi:hypothetical protein